MQKKKNTIKKPSISIITPFYNEEEAIDTYFLTLLRVLKRIGKPYEIICVNDGSTDNTPKNLNKWAKKDPKIKIINLSRNFGKEAALTAGLNNVNNQVAIPLDADLQDPPQLIPLMLEKWQLGYDVVLAKRKSRNDGFLRNTSAKLYYKFLSWLTNNKIQEEVGDFRLIDKKVIAALATMTERNRYMKGIFAWVGFKTYTVYYDRPQRVRGETKFSFIKLIQLAYDGIISFSTKPLKVWLYIGLAFSLFSFIYAAYLILRTLLYGKDLPGYTSLMVSVLFMGGLQLLSLGIIGEYIARIFKEVKHRPIYIIDEIYDKKPRTITKKFSKKT